MDAVKATDMKGIYVINQKAVDNIIDELKKNYKFPLCIGTASTSIPGLKKLRQQIVTEFETATKKEAEEKGVEFIERMTSVIVVSLERMKKCIACDYFNKCVLMVREEE